MGSRLALIEQCTPMHQEQQVSLGQVLIPSRMMQRALEAAGFAQGYLLMGSQLALILQLLLGFVNH